jgi:hypothetical protein
MSLQSSTVAEAKAKFSEIVERAMAEEPQTIARNGRKDVAWWSGQRNGTERQSESATWQNSM